MRLLIIFISSITYLETIAGDIGCRLIRQIRRSNKALVKEILFKTIKAIRCLRYW
jgi:hypothetical protein